MLSKKFRNCRAAAPSLAAGMMSAAALVLSGCGMGTQAGPSATALAVMSGQVHGGQSPIQGATVNLYTTSATATSYGAAATLIGTATTDVNGSFSIAPSATSANCPSGQQAYITAAGGYQTGQSTLVNSNMLEMAALGDCKNISASTSVTVSEVTTIAAAYALSGFMTTSLNTAGTLYQANVSAPVANNSAVSAITAAAPAGLAHAFLNAALLASYATGQANASATTTSAGATVTAKIPVAEINTLADAMASCVNSKSSGTASGTQSTNCNTLFSLTPSISGVTPANTLQAFINLARNPYPSASAVSDTSGLLSLASSTAPFVPILTTSPLDWTMAVDWNGGPASATSYYLALDANDTVYAGYGTTSSTTPALYGVSAYGLTVPTFGSPSALASTPVSRGIATDTNGNLYLANNAAAVDRFSTTSGSLLSTYTGNSSSWALAVDKANNLWVGHVVTTAAAVNLEEVSLATGTLTQVYSNHSTFAPYGIAIDAFQDVWQGGYYSSGTLAQVLANTGSVAAPNYGTANTAGTGIVTATLAGSATKPYQTVFDSSGNAYQTFAGGNTTATTGFEEIVPGASTTATTPTFPLTALDPLTPVLGTTAGSTAQNNTLGTAAAVYPAIDGAGTIFIPDNNSSSQGIHAYVTQSPSSTFSHILSPTTGFKGCSLQSSATTCGTTTTAAIYSPRSLVIDSTGSVWANVTASGLVQVIGLAAPTYPQLSLGNWSLAPGNTAVATLP